MGILKYLKEEWETPKEDYAEDDPDRLKIYEGNIKAWYLLIIKLTYITFWVVRQCNDNAHEAWKVIIDKYEVSDEKQESLNEMTNIWNNFRIKGKMPRPRNMVQ